MNEIVKYNNNLNRTNIGSFRQVELDLFFSICMMAKDKGTDEIVINFDKLKELSNYSQTSKRVFAKDIDKTYDKFLGMRIKLGNENEWVGFNLFNKYEISIPKEKVTLKINKEFGYILNQISSEFTRFELSEFTGLSSTYAKNMYRLLKQFRHTGYYKISILDFRELLGIPNSYNTKHIDERVLEPIIKELSPIFKNLKINKIKAKKRGNPITDYEFNFKAEKMYVDEKLVEKNKGNLTGVLCPRCEKPLMEKVINGNNCWCHSDFKTGDCDVIYNAMSDIQEERKMKNNKIKNELEQLNNQKEEIKPNISMSLMKKQAEKEKYLKQQGIELPKKVTPRMKKNQKKLKEILSNLFIR